MKKILRVAVMICLLLCVVAAASAADKFAFEKTNMTIFEGDVVNLPMIMEGAFANGGSMTWKSSVPKVAEVASDGTITALKRGDTVISCRIETDSGVKKNATVNLKVARRVTSVALKRTNQLMIFEPDDAIVLEVMQEATSYPTLVVPIGKPIALSATASPDDATNRKIAYETTDPSVAVIQGNTNVKGTKAGECDLIVSSVQNPEVTDVYHLLVVQPITKVTITADSKVVSAGSTLQLNAKIDPANAGLQAVKWSCSPETVATIDEYGTLTGLKKGTVNVKATAADGSGKSATLQLTVQQGPESVSVKETNAVINVGEQKRFTATVMPANANNKNVTWSSSDESVCTVNKNGMAKAVAIGECMLYCACDADPNVYTTVNVTIQQPVKQIVFDESTVNIYVGESAYVTWTVKPETATNPIVTLKSQNEKIATVDQSGMVTGVKRGTTKIVATATDGTKKVGSTTVKIIQPVEGVYFRQDVYHVPYQGNLSLHSWTEPKDADIQAMTWYTDDTYIATVSSSHTKSNSVSLYGQHLGQTTLHCVTDDGGYTADAIAIVDHYYDPVVINDLYLDGNQVKVRMTNQTSMTLEKVNFTIALYDQNGFELPCMADGTNFFTGYTLDELMPGESTQHGRLRFNWDYEPTQPIGGVILYVTGYTSDHYYFNDGKQVHYGQSFNRDGWTEKRYPTYFEPAPMPTAEPEAPAV